jgi:hypothetical protein
MSAPPAFGALPGGPAMQQPAAVVKLSPRGN